MNYGLSPRPATGRQCKNQATTRSPALRAGTVLGFAVQVSGLVESQRRIGRASIHGCLAVEGMEDRFPPRAVGCRCQLINNPVARRTALRSNAVEVAVAIKD